jgi:surface antigen
MLMTTIRSIAVVAAGVLALAGCSQSFGNQGVGSGPSAELAPALVDGPIGKELSDADRQSLADAEYRALEFGRTGTPVTWKNRKSGHAGEVVPGPGYKVNAFDCRDVTHTVTIDDEKQSTRTTSCRRPDGNWKPVT